MTKLVCAVLISLVSVGCAGAHRRVRSAELPDPVVGDLRCTAPKLTILEALYYVPDAGPRSMECAAPRT
ncbi:MAG: hypothetical protein JNL83_04045 [Myxococcales bacterium]|nr:hypothetical protein [Myxococcales bacterium]